MASKVLRNRDTAPNKPVTSYDVARAAGVSQSAVSRCFSPGSSISKATRAKVVAAADALGYRPNAIARSLITQRSSMVAIVVANIGFHPEMTAWLSRCFTARGLHVLLFTLEHEGDADRVVDQIWRYRVDGVVAAVHLPSHYVEAFAARRTPLVFLNRLYRDVPANSVCCDRWRASACSSAACRRRSPPLRDRGGSTRLHRQRGARRGGGAPAQAGRRDRHRP
jgi:DNA-binding LacI/PurR family transcriptional regulator